MKVLLISLFVFSSVSYAGNELDYCETSYAAVAANLNQIEKLRSESKISAEEEEVMIEIQESSLETIDSNCEAILGSTKNQKNKKYESKS